MNENFAPPKADEADSTRVPTLGEIGLSQFPPYLMNRIMGRYNQSLRDELMAKGLTTPKMRTLAVLSVIDGPMINALAVYAVVEQSTLSRALDQLNAEGLVRRATDPADSRATRIFITDAGRTLFEALWPSMYDAYSPMFAGVPDAERAAFIATLQKLLHNIRKHEF